MKTNSWFLGSLLLVSFCAALAHAQPYESLFDQCRYSDNPSIQVELFGSYAFDALVKKVKTSKRKYGLVKAVAATGHPGVKAFLLKILKNPESLDPSVRRTLREQAIEGLERFASDPRVVKAMAEFILDPKAGRFPKEDAASFLAKYPHRAGASELIAWDKVHGDSNTPLVNTMAEALGKTPGPEMTKYLKQKLSKTSRAYMPWYARNALGAGRLKRLALLDELIAAAEKGLGNRTVVPEVYRALGLMGDRRAVDVLKKAVLKKDFRIRYWSAVSLGLLGDKSAKDDLRQAFLKVRDYAASHRYVNQAAISFALAKLGDSKGEKFLQKLSKSKEAVERMYGLMFLLMLQQDRAGSFAFARRIMDEIRPYKDIGGCPRFPFEQIFDAMMATGSDEILSMIQQVSLWEKAGSGPYAAKRALARMQPKKQASFIAKRMKQGSWTERNKAARELERLPVDALSFYARTMKKGDVEARVLAVRRAGLIFPKRSSALLRKALKDSAWQVVDEARRMLVLMSGKKACPAHRPEPRALAREIVPYTPGLSPPKNKGPMVQNPIEDYRHRHPLSTTIVRRLINGKDGSIWAATRYGLMRYDGMQWHNMGTEQGLCSDDVYDVAISRDRTAVATSKGLALMKGGRFKCIPSTKPLYRVAARGKEIFATTRSGVLRLVGGNLKNISWPNAPEGKIGSVLLDSRGALWVALVPDASWWQSKPENQAPLYRHKKGSWKAYVEPFVHFQGKVNRGVGPSIGMAGVLDMALAPGGKIYLATSQGLMWFDGRKFNAQARSKSYWPWHEAHSVALGPKGEVLVGYPGYLDVFNNGHWKRIEYQALPKPDSVLVPGTPAISMLWSDSGEIWWSGASVINSKAGQMGTVFRTLVRDKARVALPPDTLISNISGGGFRLDSPSVDLAMPNRARLFDGGKTIRVPANTITVSALAKDPWDFGSVQYRFKVDEDKWTKWSESNALISPKILDDGIHRIQVQSRDQQGNLDPSPALVRFSVQTKEVTVIKILDGQFQRVFPSQYLRLQKIGFGKVKLRNSRNKPVKVNLELNIEDLFEKPASVEIRLASREEKWVTLPAPFSEKILRSDGKHDAKAIVEARYTWQDVERSTRRSFNVNILDANALVWTDPAAVASFVNPADPLVQQLASGAYRKASTAHARQVKTSHPLRNFLLAMYAYNALWELGIKYKPDPVRPFSSLSSGALDTVQFPSQTLLRKTGDCDDLTVLFASILENMNIPTAPLVVEGHVFLMFYAGVIKENASSFPVPQSEMVSRDGKLWIPVETTMLGKSGDFSSACAEGGHNFHGRYKPAGSQVIVLSSAWKDYPPALLKSSGTKRLAALKMKGAQKQARALMLRYSEKLQNMVATKGHDRASVIKRASILVKAGMFAQSIELFQKALKQKDDFVVRYGLGAAQAGQGEILMALVEFGKALKMAKGSKQKFRSLLAVAQCYKTDGNLAKARENLDRALKINPAAKFDKRYSSLVRYLRTENQTKAAGQDEAPPFFQELLLGL